jgi:iron complex transport system permease protein
MKRKLSLLVVLVLILFVLNMMVGAVNIPVRNVWNILMGGMDDRDAWRYIILQSRLPQALTAILSGGALAMSGLMLQTAFRNPLADPSIFGISSGAGLGVALVMLLMGGTLSTGVFTITGFAAVFIAAFIGAMVVILIILFFSSIVRNHVMLLIIGIMIGYLSASAISLLNFFATEEGVKSYLVWGLGNFGGVTMEQMPIFAAVTIIGIMMAMLLIKPLNALLLGDKYAQNLGVNIVIVRNALLIITGVLTAIVTAFCGPISFIGLAVPHVARLWVKTDDHIVLMPATLLSGSVIALVCNLLCVLPGDAGIIPLNAVTPLMGAPVIIYILLKQKHA